LLLVLAALLAMVRRDLPLSELRARYAPAPSRFTQIEGMSVHYRDEGQGHPLVLLHGASSSLHTWDGWADMLRTHRRVIRLDMPGFGLTGPAPDRDYSVARLARVVGKLLDKLGIEQADLAGNSLGGRVAVTFALASPRRARRLILIDAAGLSGQTPPRLFRVARSRIGGILVRWLGPRFLVRANVEEVYADKSRISEELIDRYQAMALRAGNRQAVLDRVSGPQGPVLDGLLKQLRLPTLLQWGAQDRWIPLSFGQRMHSGIAGSELIVYPKVGHVPMEEQPFVTARDADAFLESTDAEPSLLDQLEDGDQDVPFD
jgi:pimeloyl-ACP methyl ester carboxylesterase